MGLKSKKVSNIVSNKKSRRETRPKIIRDSRRDFPASKRGSVKFVQKAYSSWLNCANPSFSDFFMSEGHLIFDF